MPRLPPKPKLLRSNPNRFTSIRFQGTSPYTAPDDEDLCASSVRKPKVPRFKPDLDADSEELSDYVKTRLLIARVLAMKKYQEMQG